jgi:hypothetical protein
MIIIMLILAKICWCNTDKWVKIPPINNKQCANELIIDKNNNVKLLSK